MNRLVNVNVQRSSDVARSGEAKRAQLKKWAKRVFIVLAVLTAPVWGNLWIAWRIFRFLIPFFLIAAIAGCAHSSNRFDRSPCACEFKQINTGDYEESARA